VGAVPYTPPWTGAPRSAVGNRAGRAASGVTMSDAVGNSLKSSTRTLFSRKPVVGEMVKLPKPASLATWVPSTATRTVRLVR